MEGSKNSTPGIFEFTRKILFDTDSTRQFMRNHGLLKDCFQCVNCCENMVKGRRKDISDGEYWRCRICEKKKSIRTGTIFQESKLQLEVLMMIIYCFCLDFQICDCLKLLPNVDKKTVIDWYSFCRDVCSHALISDPVILGGENDSNIIEIDESLFGKKRKYNRGTGNQNMWVFGICERGTRKSVMQIVQKRDAATLLPIIQKYVKRGSTIYSDCWGAYCRLGELGYTHGTVNHSEEFKSSDGVCTNGIEGLWGNVKRKIKKMKGILPTRVPAFLDEYMYRFRYGCENGDIFWKFLTDIGKFNDRDVEKENENNVEITE